MSPDAKFLYNPSYFDRLCPVLARHLPTFDESAFIIRVFNNAWPDLDFEGRARHIAHCLHAYLPSRFEDAAPKLINIARDLSLLTDNRPVESVFLPVCVTLYGQMNSQVAARTLSEMSPHVDVSTLQASHEAPLAISDRVVMAEYPL